MPCQERTPQSICSIHGYPKRMWSKNAAKLLFTCCSTAVGCYLAGELGRTSRLGTLKRLLSLMKGWDVSLQVVQLWRGENLQVTCKYATKILVRWKIDNSSGNIEADRYAIMWHANIQQKCMFDGKLMTSVGKLTASKTDKCGTQICNKKSVFDGKLIIPMGKLEISR